jgi:hypothetical protein
MTDEQDGAGPVMPAAFDQNVDLMVTVGDAFMRTHAATQGKSWVDAAAMCYGIGVTLELYLRNLGVQLVPVGALAGDAAPGAEEAVGNG